MSYPMRQLPWDILGTNELLRMNSTPQTEMKNPGEIVTSTNLRHEYDGTFYR